MIDRYREIRKQSGTLFFMILIHSWAQQHNECARLDYLYFLTALKAKHIVLLPAGLTMNNVS